MSGKKGGFAGMLKLGVVLALYAVAACVGLAFVYDGTAKIIAQRQRADLEASLSELFSDADDFKAISGIKSGDPTVTIEEDGTFAAYKNGQVIGAVLRTSRASYNGAIKILVGVGTNGKISGVKILEHSDTPGLGANAASAGYYVDRAKGIHFYDQFAGKAVSDPFVPKNDVVAITAATITSRAVAASVKAAGEAALAWFAGGKR
jgi:Na+-translocating ferredoxin:NAD+ oxidoreductase subunit G